MPDAVLLQSAVIQVADGNVEVEVYDAVAPDHLYQHLWRSNLRAHKARAEDQTPVTPRELKRLVVHPGEETA